MSADLDALSELLHRKRIAVLTGAGISTDSGIPDYRGPETRKRARSPIQYNAFMQDESARKRYWMRSAAGWARMSGARANASHHALARLERAGLLAGLVTQNVDGLHHQAGSSRVVELHGSLDRVVCLGCGVAILRADFQHTLLRLNPSWSEWRAPLAPDGDAEVVRDAASFAVPACTACGGVLKPDVVFFGESVPGDRVQAAWNIYDASDVLLVVGSSLAVYSGFRFVQRAVRDAKPVALVTLGPTRADALATVRLDAPLASVLPLLADRLVDPVAAS